MTRALDQLRDRLAGCMVRDRYRLQVHVERLEKALSRGKAGGRDGPRRRTDRGERNGAPPLPTGAAETRTEAADDRHVAWLERQIAQSIERVAARRAGLPVVTYDEELPVAAARAEIRHAVDKHQVVVLCGETGSGKTTQLPKILLEMGRGVEGMIGHTQPRRIAARSVAGRLAQELGVKMGEGVGYKVRFTDHSARGTYVKLMTDGILLAETQGDRLLTAYDTLIIDEAHERSLNIDFLLGYLKQLVKKRRELKVIVTSATIDPDSFSRHFDGAPVLMAPGRTYPVDVRYRPIGEGEGADEGLYDAIVRALEEIEREEGGARGEGRDVLVFLSGEREIREATEVLRKRGKAGEEVLPLYARLGATEQNRVFQPHRGRRIVLATNVAETSLTVPGIRYVIDPGLARMGRYSARSGVQRLPIEEISRASADQRKGRCGRVGPGVCVRLYSEASYEGRDAYTQPEIMRTNLAGVILQMKALRLGEVERFPFMERPRSGMIRDGYRTLHELGAVDGQGRLTEVGWSLSRLPIDPRVGRMVLESVSEGCLRDVLAIAAGLSVQDPRERPMEKQDAADAAHAKFRHEDSDFLTLLNVWRAYQRKKHELSGNKLKGWCKERFLSVMRMREWEDIHGQLRSLVAELGIGKSSQSVRTGAKKATTATDETAERAHHEAKRDGTDGSGDEGKRAHVPIAGGDTEENYSDGLTPVERGAIHRSLLSGLISNVAKLHQNREYIGTGGTRLSIFPGSALYRQQAKWIMCAEQVETSRLYARMVARVRPEWIEKVGGHMVRREYAEARWDSRRGHACVEETVTLMGLEVIAGREVELGRVDRKAARELFIHHALVNGDLRGEAGFLEHNRRLVAEVERWEAKLRRRDLLSETRARAEFYDARVPEGVHSAAAFQRWRSHAERTQPDLLRMSERDVARGEVGEAARAGYPDSLEFGGRRFALEYRFEPGHAEDGVTLVAPVESLAIVDAQRCGWLVRGMLDERIVALIRAMPKGLRTSFVPAPDVAAACAAKMSFGVGGFIDAVRQSLGRMTGVSIPAGTWSEESLPDYLRMNFRVTDGSEHVVAQGRDLSALRRRFGVRAAATESGDQELRRDGLTTWDIETLPERTASGAYPTLVDRMTTVSLTSVASARHADLLMRFGVRRLLYLECEGELRFQADNMASIDRMSLLFASRGGRKRLIDELCLLIADRAFLGDEVDGSLEETRWLSSAGQDEIRGKLPRTKEAYQEMLGRGWRRLVPTGHEIGTMVLEVLTRAQQVEMELERRSAVLPGSIVMDVKSQLQNLMPARFLSETSWPWLRHYPRYLRAVLTRLGKVQGATAAGADGVTRATEDAIEVTARWVERFNRHAAEGRVVGVTPVDPALGRYRWLVEEYRVSLFAQELGTVATVSRKRLDELWERVSL